MFNSLTSLLFTCLMWRWPPPPNSCLLCARLVLEQESRSAQTGEKTQWGRERDGQRETWVKQRERGGIGGGSCVNCVKEKVCVCVFRSRSVTMISLYSLLSTSQCDLTTQTATLRLLIKLTPLLGFLLLFLGFFLGFSQRAKLTVQTQVVVKQPTVQVTFRAQIHSRKGK